MVRPMLYSSVNTNLPSISGKLISLNEHMVAFCYFRLFSLFCLINLNVFSSCVSSLLKSGDKETYTAFLFLIKKEPITFLGESSRLSSSSIYLLVVFILYENSSPIFSLTFFSRFFRASNLLATSSGSRNSSTGCFMNSGMRFMRN